MENEKSSNLYFKAQRIMKNNFLLIAMLAITCCFGQTKKAISNPKKVSKAVEVKEIPYEERINYIKGDPDDVATLAVESAPIIREEDINTIYNTAGIEVKPEFPGGIEKLITFLSRNFIYTDEMKEAELKGRIFVTFVVERDGSLTDIKVLRGLGFGTEVEAIQLFKKMPKWLPGEQNGKKVRCSYSFPITIDATKQ